MNATAYHILLIEDTPMNMKMTTLVLEHAGFTVDGAANAHEALSAVADHDYDAIVLDVRLPDMEGLELVRRLRALPATQNVPIVAISAWAMPEDSERALAACCDGYITKPIDVSRFADEIRQHIVNSGKHGGQPPAG